MTQRIEIARHSDTDMAYVLLDGAVVFMGNEWDFHAGCQGTTISGIDLAGKWDSGVDSLANLLAGELRIQGATVEVSSRELTDKENDLFCYGPRERRDTPPAQGRGAS